MSENSSGGIFINGKQQIIDMLPLLAPEERKTLLKNINKMNPTLAKELIHQGMGARDFLNLDDSEIQLVFTYIRAPIMGLILKSFKSDEQRRVLSLCDRTYAQAAFKVMKTQLQNESRDMSKALERLKTVLGNLSQQGRISIF